MGFVGDLTQADRDAGVSGASQRVESEVALGGHVLGAVPGADLGRVLGEGGVSPETEPVLDSPERVRVREPGDPLGGCLEGRQVGDHVHGLA